ncbi:MAG: PHP domain-containing protein [Ignavibacteriae bacterium]|nr:PHP domain-containing protein [Ignavibacteriota bacterium]MCB9208396.1 PHP domain-containing protein [Ignavibacteriales bacterium]MCB9259158.1 PHP domain-containing protein [Ignavibacteriales bacterium]
MKKISLILFLTFSFLITAHNKHENDRKIIFPNIPGYKTLKCDFHQHTAFSDGHVWPTIRVMEAVKDNLDAIAVTEHLEYQPHKDDIPHPDRNRAYEIEKKASENDSLIIIRGSEITRNMPPGHSNAIFINDANKLMVDNPIKAFEEAKNQGAFVFWNHPNWTAQRKDGIATLTDMHKDLIKNGLLNGIEIVNEFTYSDEALQIALDNNLTLIGTSDIHGLIDWEYNVPDGGHRPVTIVFAKERSESAIKEALENRRTVVFFNDILIGRTEQLVPLLKSSITIDNAEYDKDAIILKVRLKNNSSCKFTLQNKSEFTFHRHSDLVEIEPMSTVELEIKTVNKLSNAVLKFEVINAVTAPAIHPEIVFEITP